MIGDFRGAAKRLDDIDLPKIGREIGVGEDEIHAILDVETVGTGFDILGRPKMLFEPHVFYKRLNLKGFTSLLRPAIEVGLAYPKWGTEPYPKDSYPRLKEAMRLDAKTALESASWGLGQVMGFNFPLAGYSGVEAMVIDFMADEENQLQGMISFIKAAGLDRALRSHNWARFAEGYNGAGFRRNGYDKKLKAAFERWQKIKDTPYP